MKIQPTPVEGESADLAETSAVLRALADPTRLRVYLLLRQGEACVCELAATLDLAENLVSHHLAALRRVGLARDRRDPGDARWVYYHLDEQTLTHLARTLGGLFDPATIGVRAPVCGPAAPIPIPRRALRPARPE